MAGDLFIENLSLDQLRLLTEAHATEVREIYHANRSWNEYENVLRTRLQAGPPSMRAGLPAHAYVTFYAVNRAETAAYVAADGMNRLGRFVLNAVTRPLGLVTANPRLNGWDALVGFEAKVNMLINALQWVGVIIEYYKYADVPILDVRRGWRTNPEQEHV